MRTLSLLLILFLLVPLLVAQGNPSDDRIYDEVRRRLANDVEVRAAGFDILVKAGAVTMRGRVRDDKAKEKAEKIVKKVKGVVSVKNELKLVGSD